MDAEVAIKKIGNDLMIGFNPKFLVDALKNIEDEEISIYMSIPRSPCFIRDDNKSYNYMILPVNFNADAV
jgi:DNA polymerase-3 subunit beta